MKHLSTLVEGVSPIVYHHTTQEKAFGIIRNNRIELTSNLGTASDMQKSGNKFYFFSVATVPYGGYREAISEEYQAVLKLDGNKLNQTYKGIQVDYWGSEFKKTNRERYDEYEERVVTDSPYIKNATKYIKEVHSGWSSGGRYNPAFGKLQTICESKNIPFFAYDIKTSGNAFKILNKRKAMNLSGAYSHIQSVLNVIKAKSRGSVDYDDWKKVSNGMYEILHGSTRKTELETQIENEVHNAKSRPEDMPKVRELTKAMRKYGARTIRDFLLKVVQEKEDWFK